MHQGESLRSRQQPLTLAAGTRVDSGSYVIQHRGTILDLIQNEREFEDLEKFLRIRSNGSNNRRILE